MKHLFLFGGILLAGCYIQPAVPSYQLGVPGTLGVQAGPPIAYGGQPEMVVLPGTNVYVAPGVATDLYFADGYWWRPYGGGWYRSAYYDRGWGPYSGVPGWYRGVPNNWRYNYEHHQWNGRTWNYEHVQAAAHGQQFHAGQPQVQHGYQPHLTQPQVPTQSQSTKKKKKRSEDQ